MTTHPRRRLALALTLGALLTLGAIDPRRGHQGTALPAQRRRPLVHPRRRLPRGARPRRDPTPRQADRQRRTWPPTSTPTTTRCRPPASASPPSPSCTSRASAAADASLSSAGEVCGLLRPSARQHRDAHLHRTDDHRGIRPATPRSQDRLPRDPPRRERKGPRLRHDLVTRSGNRGGTRPSGLVPSAARVPRSACAELGA